MRKMKEREREREGGRERCHLKEIYLKIQSNFADKYPMGFLLILQPND
jgi:hypothetical protein